MNDNGKLEFASDAWVDAIREELEKGLAGEDLSDVDFSACEEYTSPPAHLLKPGATTVGFHFRIRPDGVTVGNVPAADVTFKVTGDYKTIRDLARMTKDETETKTGTSIGELLGALIKNGSVTLDGDMSARPEVLEKVNLHDRMAGRTA